MCESLCQVAQAGAGPEIGAFDVDWGALGERWTLPGAAPAPQWGVPLVHPATLARGGPLPSSSVLADGAGWKGRFVNELAAPDWSASPNSRIQVQLNVLERSAVS